MRVLLNVVAHGVTAASLTRLFLRSHRVLPETDADLHPVRKRVLQDEFTPQE